MAPALYKFNQDGDFQVSDARSVSGLYFPLVNEAGLLSAITPDLAGDIKLDQHTFLTLPVAWEDLHLNRAARNFWVRTAGQSWAVNGRSAWQRALPPTEENVAMKAGFLWHEVTRTNKKIGLKSVVLNFVPMVESTFEVMRVEIENVSKKPLLITPTAAIPLYGRSADNLRDHRHVTSLLNRVSEVSHGLRLCPTMSFNEKGHKANSISYLVLGADDKGGGPTGFFPTVASFIGEGGDLERPAAIFDNVRPKTQIGPDDQGKEAMGGLRFNVVTLKPGQKATYILFLGIDAGGSFSEKIMKEWGTVEKVDTLLQHTKASWRRELDKILFETGDATFNHWISWVQLQPTLRKIYGCSFLPDFDYGRGGRGWRDLWQDCLALLLANPAETRDLIRNNFSGIRMDGSNATIIGRRQELTTDGRKIWVPEFVADRNNITRTWMDHGTWPFLTTELYLDQTGDWEFLFEEVPYFWDAQVSRARKINPKWSDPACLLRTKNGETYKGTILEHILVQNLVQFYNVGEHNLIRLEDADWNDGLDMAKERGESAAFTSLYAGNLAAIAGLLERLSDRHNIKEISVAEELGVLLGDGPMVDVNSADQKTLLLGRYFDDVANGVSGHRVTLTTAVVVADLRKKSDWLKKQINDQEFIEAKGQHWYNGYYDNDGKRVEGINEDGKVCMTLTGQVYPLMAGVASDSRVEAVIKAVDKYLWDSDLGGVRLNTDFGKPMPRLGRAFSFAYGEKENGAVFSHMAVMYANALYKRGFIAEGFRVLNSLYRMAVNSNRSRILPGLPEYFNNVGRGRYHYLTGSASWYVLTLLTQVFGVRGEGGDLVLEPKLVPEQFNKKGRASVSCTFAGRAITVVYENKKRVDHDRAKITSVADETGPLSATLGGKSVRISRKDFLSRNSPTIVVQLN